MAMLLTLLVVAGGGYWTIHLFTKQEVTPVRHVRIEGMFQNLRKRSVQVILMPLVKGGFWGLDLKKIVAAVNALPWVDRVKVERVWPDTLSVYIDEQIPYVRWGEDSLLNVRGESFTPPSMEAFGALVWIKGPEGQEVKLISILKQLQTITGRQGLHIAQFIINEQSSWFIRLSSGVELALGQKKPLAVLERFMAVLPMMGEQRRAAIQSVDLRYPSGFSVNWKLQPEFEMELAEDNVVF